MGELHGNVSGSCTYESGITERARGSGGWWRWRRQQQRGGRRRRGTAKDFVVSRTFYSVSSGWRLLSGLSKDEFEFAVFLLLSLFRCPPAPVSPSSSTHSSVHSPRSSSLAFSLFLSLFSSLKALRNSQQPSPSRRENLTLENFPLAKIFISFSATLCAATFVESRTLTLGRGSFRNFYVSLILFNVFMNLCFKLM